MTAYDEILQAELYSDDTGQLRQIFHKTQFFPLDQNIPRNAASEYLQKIASYYNIPLDQLAYLHQQVSFLDPQEQEVSYRLNEEKNFFDSSTLSYFQTIHNVPVWQAGISVIIKQNPNRAVLSSNTSRQNVQCNLPSKKHIKRWKDILLQQAAPPIHKLIGAGKPGKNPSRLIRGRFYAYQYDSKDRQAEDGGLKPHFSFPLPPVPENVKQGEYYLVAEITFSYETVEFGNLNWRALVEIETDTILYLRALADNVFGNLIVNDPARIPPFVTPASENATLNSLRTFQTLPNLDAPSGGVQHLQGTFAILVNEVSPYALPPTEPAGRDFDFDVRTDDFSAVSAYYSVNRFFEMVEDLGFSIPAYFSHSRFPIHVDHRGSSNDPLNGYEINSFCYGDGSGIYIVGYCLADLSDTTHPLGIAMLYDITLHELGGHGVLYEHIEAGNFPFVHSAGDSFAAILNDPTSEAADRFLTFPWVYTDRRHDRSLAEGWAWAGTNDRGVVDYGAEQILSTTHFRIYRSIGGDHPDLGRRIFAARAMAYLLLRTISNLTASTVPSNATMWCNTLMATDLLNWNTEGIFGGAYNKVIRWAFEKQGLFQPPGTPRPVVHPGQPPAIDVYIDDGRHGEYSFIGMHWENLSIWNQRAITDPPVHAAPIMGAMNFAYVKVKNRGTLDASDVTVRAYHCLPGAGLTWPGNFTEMSPAGGLSRPLIRANNIDEIIFGPFAWVPNTNAYGHDCILMIASQAQDPSNVDNFTAGESVEEWRLVPNDNNVGQRNVYPVAGGAGAHGLIGALHGRSMFVNNPHRKQAGIDLKVQWPDLLAGSGWAINFKDVDNNQFSLGAGEKRELIIQLVPGDDFSPKQVIDAKERNIRILVYADNMLMGGMTYELDPAGS